MKNESSQNEEHSRREPVFVPDAPTTVITSDGVTKQKHFVTTGEKKFDTLTYNRIGYIANALLSVVAVYWVERTHGGQQMMKNFGEWVGKKFPKVDPHTAQHLANKSFFLSGGFAVLLPMKWLEDHKVQMIRKWNQEIYGDKIDTDPVLVQSEKELERAPKQTWASIFSSRALALIPFYATVGLLWDKKSILSRVTDSNLRGMSGQEIRTLDRQGELVSKGLYFDRPIAATSRFLGKIAAKVTGNEAALGKIEEMQTKHPGMIKQGAMGSADRDPIHSTLPYYFISEAITSAMVAWGVYVLTRVTAVLFHNKPHIAPQPEDKSIVTQQPAAEEKSQEQSAAPKLQVSNAHWAGQAASATEQALSLH